MDWVPLYLISVLLKRQKGHKKAPTAAQLWVPTRRTVMNSSGTGSTYWFQAIDTVWGKNRNKIKASPCHFWFPSVFCFFFICVMGLEKKKKGFSFSPPSRRLTSHEPWSHRQRQKTAQPTTQRTAPVSLRCFKLFFQKKKKREKKKRAFLDVLSDLYQADTVPRRSGILLGLVPRERDRVRESWLLDSFFFVVLFFGCGDAKTGQHFEKGGCFIAVSCWAEQFSETQQCLTVSMFTCTV